MGNADKYQENVISSVNHKQGQPTRLPFVDKLGFSGELTI